MLVVDISISRRKNLEGLRIQRIKGKIGQKCIYKIRRPLGFEKHNIEHHYNDGAYLLLLKAFRILAEAGYGKRTDNDELFETMVDLIKMDNCDD